MDKKRMLTLSLLGIGIIVLSTTIFFVVNPQTKNKNKIPTTNTLVEQQSEDSISEPTYNGIFTTNTHLIEFGNVINNDFKEIEISNSLNTIDGKLYRNDTNNIVYIIKSDDVNTKFIVKQFELINEEYVSKEYNINLDVYENIIGVSILDKDMMIITQEIVDNVPCNIIYKFNTDNTLSSPDTIIVNNVNSEKAFVFENKLYSLKDTFITQINLETLEQESLNLGEETIDYFSIKDKLYVYNNFGSGNNNSLLFEINLNTFRVDNLFETKDNRMFIKGIDFLNNKMYLQSKQINIEDLLKEDNVEKGFKIIELDLETMKTSNVIDSNVEFEQLITNKDLLFNNEFFILN